MTTTTFLAMVVGETGSGSALISTCDTPKHILPMSHCEDVAEYINTRPARVRPTASHHASLSVR